MIESGFLESKLGEVLMVGLFYVKFSSANRNRRIYGKKTMLATV
jgi:hypothetical protein